MIVARTLKGKGISFTEDKDGWHGKALKKGDELNKALADPAVTERLSRLTIEPRLMKPQEFDDFLRKDVDTARRMLQAAGVNIHQ